MSGPFLPTDDPVETDTPEWSVDGHSVAFGGTSAIPAGFDRGFHAWFGHKPTRVLPPAPVVVTGERQLWQLFVRDRDRKPVAVINDMTKATLTPRWAAAGSWVVELPYDTEAAFQFRQPQAGLIVVRGEKVVLSGPVDKLRPTFRDGRDTLIVEGSDDTAWLANNPARTQPQTRVPPWITQNFDTRVGVASTIMREFVDENIGPSAFGEWRVPGLTLGPDPSTGSVVVGRGDMGPLIDLLTSIAQQSDPQVGFRIIQTDDLRAGMLRFDVLPARDRSRDIVFAVPLRNLIGSDISIAAGPNGVIAAGPGEGVERMFVERTDPQARNQWGPRTTFVQHADVETPTELRDAADTDLRTGAVVVTVAVDVADDTPFRWGDEYNLGDLVTITVRDFTLVAPVREAEITIDEHDVHVQPRVGTAGAALDPNEERDWAVIRQLRDRVARLERH